jgi:hypothetical protein
MAKKTQGLKIQEVNPSKIRLLKKNARYMPKIQFEQLCNNIKRDGFLSSTPLCHTLKDGSLEVLSGNHRVEASREAGLDKISVMVLPEELGKSRKIAVQLSHNSLAGRDDEQILASLWADLADMEDAEYSGLDTETIERLEAIEFSAFNAAQVPSEAILLWFIPEEVERVDALIEECEKLTLADSIYLAPMECYERVFDAIVKTKRVKNIKNTAVAFMKLVELVEQCVESIESDASCIQ